MSRIGPRPPRRTRPVVGWSLLAIGAVHVAAAPAIHPESLRSIWEGGVLDAVDREPALAERRGVGFWYVTAGLGVLLLGLVVRRGELRTGRPPRELGWGLLGFTAWGAALMPKSGFWAFLVPGVLALRKGSRGGDQAP